MYCKNCGAVVVGRFCSCCGKRVLNSLEEFKRVEKITLKEYKNQFERFCNDERQHNSITVMHLADACWIACVFKHARWMPFSGIKGDHNVTEDAYEKLATVKEHATKLCERLLTADDF